MKAYLKFGGLALSAGLTLGLFVRLFGANAYGIFLAVAALALFEGGAIAWNGVLADAKHGQRTISRSAQWFCVLASVLSSGAEIILSSRIWSPPFDVGFMTLWIIVGTLAVNVIGVIKYEMLDPLTESKHRELDRAAKAKREAARLEDQVIEQAMIKADSEVARIAGSVSDALAAELRDDVTAYLLASTRNGHNLPVPANRNLIHAEAPPAPVLATPPSPKAGRGANQRSEPPTTQ